MKTLLMALALSFAAQDLPDYGNINQIKDLQRVYVASENEDSRKRIVKALAKRLQVVDSPSNAQFFIEYLELSREAVSTDKHLNERQQRNQMRAYILGPEKQKIVVWADTRSRDTDHFLGMKMYDSGRNETELVNKFLKAFKKLSP